METACPLVTRRPIPGLVGWLGIFCFQPGSHPGALVAIPMVRERVSFVAAFLPLVLAALAPEDRCLGNFPIGCHDVEICPIQNLAPCDGVAAVAALE